jgi:hypothetical protein
MPQNTGMPSSLGCQTSGPSGTSLSEPSGPHSIWIICSPSVV